MFRTRVTELFGIEHPIVGGCMMHISGPEFVAAISNAGALGVMASAMFDTQIKFRQAIRQVKSSTDKPFGVNLSLFPALRPIDNDLYVEVILEEGVPVVETSGQRPPEHLLARLKAGGVKTMHKCVSVRHALGAQRAGVDAVTVFGSEGGGHIGTRLLITEECPIHENLKQALAAATELDTLPILGSLHNTLRAWKNPAALKVAELETHQAELGEILTIVASTKARRMYKEGDVDSIVIACSQAIGLVRQVKSVADVISGMVQDAAAIREQLGAG
jgi:nitronate monooxygenase